MANFSPFLEKKMANLSSLINDVMFIVSNRHLVHYSIEKISL